ncbi:hypothetical protein SMICM304S_05808 [Streptomyces microflavus]
MGDQVVAAGRRPAPGPASSGGDGPYSVFLRREQDRTGPASPGSGSERDPLAGCRCRSRSPRPHRASRLSKLSISPSRGTDNGVSTWQVRAQRVFDPVSPSPRPCGGGGLSVYERRMPDGASGGEVPLHRLDLRGHTVGDTGPDVALHTRETRPRGPRRRPPRRSTTSMTSSHSPSMEVNMASVRSGSPDSRTTRTASAHYSPTSAPPSGETENATIMRPPCFSRRARAADDAVGLVTLQELVAGRGRRKGMTARREKSATRLSGHLALISIPAGRHDVDREEDAVDHAEERHQEVDVRDPHEQRAENEERREGERLGKRDEAQPVQGGSGLDVHEGTFGGRGVWACEPRHKPPPLWHRAGPAPAPGPAPSAAARIAAYQGRSGCSAGSIRGVTVP